MIVVIGGGFAGLSALRENRDALLLDVKDHFVLTPWLIDFACGDVERDFVEVKYRKVVKVSGFKVDFTGKRVITPQGVFPYDKLILSLGHHQNLPRLKGADKFARKIENLDDAEAIREAAKTARSVVIVGGGATGVELAGNLKVKDVTLIQRRDRLLPTMTNASSERARALLEERGVKVMLKTEAIEVKKDSVVTDKGEVKSDLTIFAGGLKGPSVMDELGVKNLNHRMIVERDLSSVDFKGVYGAGDCATFEKEPIPMSAEVAINAGRVAMKNAMGEALEFRPTRLATILRVGWEYFGDFGDHFVQGDEAMLMKDFSYLHSRLIPS